MEDTLWVLGLKSKVSRSLRLNPYSNGRYSMRAFCNIMRRRYPVLILILMEDTLWEKDSSFDSTPDGVLILILMEDTL